MQSGFQLCRKKAGQTFRKKLGVYNYKIGHQQYHKEPGAVNLHTVETLKKIGTPDAHFQLRHMRDESTRVMGKFVGRQFRVDRNKVPYYDIPDLNGFELKPYVSYHTPRVEEEVKQKLNSLNDFRQAQNLIPRSETLLLDKK